MEFLENLRNHPPILTKSLGMPLYRGPEAWEDTRSQPPTILPSVIGG